MSFENTILRFDCPDPETLRRRLRISSYLPVCDPNAIENAIATTPRRKLSPDEWQAVAQNMIATPDTPKGATIELVSDKRIMSVVRAFMAQELGVLAAREALEKFLPAGSGFVGTRRTEGSASSTCSVDLKIPQFTPGMDAMEGKYVYSHVDNLIHEPCKSRIESPRRLGVNLGPGDRWVVIGVPDILTIARERRLQPDDIPRTKHFAEYVISKSFNPPVPCLWLRQLAGEAYILPTELAIHDGNTIDCFLESTMAFWAWNAEVGTFSSVLTSYESQLSSLERLTNSSLAQPSRGYPSTFTRL